MISGPFLNIRLSTPDIDFGYLEPTPPGFDVPKIFLVQTLAPSWKLNPTVYLCAEYGGIQQYSFQRRGLTSYWFTNRFTAGCHCPPVATFITRITRVKPPAGV